MIRRLFQRWRIKRESNLRLIFCFDDGAGNLRRIDPIVACNQLAEDPEYLPRHVDEARLGDRQSLAICGNAANRAFGVCDVADGPAGMTLADRLALMIRFNDYLWALKKNTRRSLG